MAEPEAKRAATSAPADAGPELPAIRNVLVSEPGHWAAFDAQVASAHPERTMLALDAEWHEGRLCLLQIAFTTVAAGRSTRPPPIYVFTIDCLSETLRKESIASHVQGVLADVRLRKLVFDCREDCRILEDQLGIPPPQGLFDLQLLERLTRTEIGRKPIYNIRGLRAMIAEYPSLARFLEAKSSQDLTAVGSSVVFTQRPLPQAVLDYASCDVASLFTLFTELQQRHQFKRNPARITDDCVRGSMVYATLNFVVPPEFRRHGMLPLGVLPMSKAQGRRVCRGCNRPVASPDWEYCVICNVVRNRDRRQNAAADPAGAPSDSAPTSTQESQQTSPAKDEANGAAAPEVREGA
eukprot:CAMPEP_0174850346 /NCGR_PEP_ID=MMETSP1114-20130205/19180_1 /TAXON_ID=312471 /ORGANISM="Neobodo designis, Strain CCAP 1951/1" /LENGTH=351 /DNA_ID=CAMNT_0016084801 /DNA_START=86 /DNA_END=1141 /DNA_ORIENTATION=-